MPLDPSEGAESPALDAILRGPSAALTAVVLLAGEKARASGSAARQAIMLARRWPGPRRAVLVDLDVTGPSLHELTGVSNDEGVSDVVELGASLHRIAVPVPSQRFSLLPVGLFAGSAEAALLEWDLWPRLLLEAAGRRETLLLFVPADSPVAATLVQRVGAVLVLAAANEAKSIVERLPRQYSVLAVVTPRAEPPASESAVASSPATEAVDAVRRDGARLPQVDREQRAALAADVRRRQRAARLVRRAAVPGPASAVPAPVLSPAEETSPPVTVPVVAGVSAPVREAQLEAAADDIALDVLEPAPPVIRKRRRYIHPIGLTYVVVLLMSVAAGSLHLLAGRFGRSAAVAAPDSAPSAPPPPVPPSPSPMAAVPGANVLPFDVALEAHRDIATAFERTDALTAAHPDVSFYIAPLERDGVLHYHVRAGPVADSALALALRDTLIARQVKTRPTPADIRHTPLALLIGDYSARGDAEGQVLELRRLDIPAYLLVGVAADSAPLYRVFVGGFAGPAEAEVVRQLLRAAGVRDNLVSRTRSSTR